jgi:hypothetical protein
MVVAEDESVVTRGSADLLPVLPRRPMCSMCIPLRRSRESHVVLDVFDWQPVR